MAPIRRPRVISQLRLVRPCGTVSLMAGFSNPMKVQAEPHAAIEEIDVAATEEIEAKIKGRQADPFEHRAPDQAVAAAVDHRHRAAGLIGRRERRVAAQAALHLVSRSPAIPARQPGRRPSSRRSQPSASSQSGEAISSSSIIRKLVGGRECLQRRLERGVDRVAIALVRLDDAEPWEICRRRGIRPQPARSRIWRRRSRR